jgi:hypothetical protein
MLQPGHASQKGQHDGPRKLEVDVVARDVHYCTYTLLSRFNQAKIISL